MADTKEVMPATAAPQSAPEIVHDKEKDISKLEKVMSPSEPTKDHMNYDRVDKELAKYADAARIDISSEENKRLKRMIDTRVLPVMVFTYFLQALDKGTLSFASIMGIKTDAHLVGQQVSCLGLHCLLAQAHMDKSTPGSRRASTSPSLS
jgi:hypothetical protein